MAKLTPSEFAAKWAHIARTERAASQEYFIDLCRMLDVPTPHDADPTGEWYAFEKGTTKTSGGDGYADVWKRGHFAWEYKGKRKDLKAAYTQLLQYREALENPPCLVVRDMDRFEVHTNFAGTPTEIHDFTLTDFVRKPQEPLRVLRAVMSNPEALRPSQTRDQLTREAAEQFATLASRLRERGHDPHAVAHFLNKMLFCMFAEDAGLLPRGLFEQLGAGTAKAPDRFEEGLGSLDREDRAARFQAGGSALRRHPPRQARQGDLPHAASHRSLLHGPGGGAVVRRGEDPRTLHPRGDDAVRPLRTRGGSGGCWAAR